MRTTTPIPARDITVRRPGIDHEQPLPKYFVADDPMRSHIAAMLSSVFPEGEDFFVRSVRAYRDRIEDPELSKQVKGFIGQEAIHGREHRDFNEQLSALGYPTLGVDRLVKRFLAFLNKTTPKSHQLAVTAALEHYTATLAEALLRDDAARAEFVTDEVRALFSWHALEETEHKSVAFDVYEEVSGRYVERVGTMVAVHIGFLAVMSGAVAVSVAKDPKAWRKLPKSLLGLRTHPFFQPRVISRLLDYNRKGFHPDDHDTVELLEEWRARYEAGIAA
jgi:predicted metal-dependent hydrolase